MPTTATLYGLGALGNDGGADKLVIDDSSASSTRTTINISDNTALDNINLLGFVQMQVKTHPVIPYDAVIFTGHQAPSNFVTITGNAGDDFVGLGTVASPIVASSYGANFDFELGTGNNYIEIHDTTDASSSAGGDTWGFSYDTISVKDVFARRFTASASAIWSIYADAGNTVFDMGGVQAGWAVHLYGGAGNDQVVQVDQILDGLSPTLPIRGPVGDADYLLGSGFSFDGGTGTDQFLLDCSFTPGDPGQNSQYFLDSGELLRAPAGQPLTHVVALFSNLEDIRFTADDEPNLIRFGNLGPLNVSGIYVEIDAGGGDDVITNVQTVDPASLATELPTGVVAISGGTGSNTLELDDSAGTQAVYTIDRDQFNLDSALRAHTGYINFTEFDTLDLTGSPQSDTFNVSRILTDTHLMVAGGNGDDQFVVGNQNLDLDGFSTNTSLFGGQGNDSILFDDSGGGFNRTVAEDYTFSSLLFTKAGVLAITYTTFESQELDASTVVQNNLNILETVNLNVAPIPTTIVGGMTRNCLINVGTGDLGFFAPITLTMGGACSAAVNDQTSTANTGYTLSSGLLTTTTGRTIHFSGGGGITLNASAGLNIINVTSSGTSQPFIVNCNNGDDTVNAGSGNLDVDFQSNLTVNGGGGSDLLVLNNTTDNTLESQSLDAGVFTDGRTFSYAGVESLNLNSGSGGGTVNVNTVSVFTVLVGGSGVDTYNVGTGNLDTTLLADININGGDFITLDDHNATAAPDTYNFDSSNSFHKNTAGHVVSMSNGARGVLLCNSGGNTINVNQDGSPLSIFGNAGSDTLNITGSFIGNFKPNVTFDGGTGLDTINTITTASNTAMCTLAANYQDLSTVSVNAGATLVVPSRSVADIQVSFSLTGVVDLAGGALIYRGAASQISTFATRVKNGYSNGTWTGTTGASINSSLAALTPAVNAVGYATSQQLFSTFPATFAGVSINANDLLVRYTLAADASLNKTVNALDFNALATNFGSITANWYQGDFNYDGRVNTADFTALALNFSANLASAAPLAAIETSTRPDPAASKVDLFGKKIIGENNVHDLLEVTSSTL